MREYVLYCVDCHEYTGLGAFIEKEGSFEGEYSLLYNRKANHGEVMCRFLIRHARHTLRVEVSRTQPYSEIVRTAARFMEPDIDKIIERQMERNKERESERSMERGLGQLQLNVLRGILTEESDSISRERSDNAAKAQFLLGKEEGMKLAMRLLEELLEKTNLLFK